MRNEEEDFGEIRGRREKRKKVKGRFFRIVFLKVWLLRFDLSEKFQFGFI